jgi:hypothetical protein
MPPGRGPLKGRGGCSLQYLRIQDEVPVRPGHDPAGQVAQHVVSHGLRAPPVEGIARDAGAVCRLASQQELVGIRLVRLFKPVKVVSGVPGGITDNRTPISVELEYIKGVTITVPTFMTISTASWTRILSCGYR